MQGLDTIAWGKLSHAYGQADDVPGQLRGLLAPDEETRARALKRLCASICHQGTRYTASAPAIPLLFEILEDPATDNRADILDLILCLALGYPEELLPEGVDVKTNFGDGKSQWSRICRKCYRAFADRWQTLQRLTADPDPEVRLLAIYALAWIPKQAPALLETLRALLGAEREPLFRASEILAIGLLSRYCGETADAPLLAGELSSDIPIVRLASAIAIVTMPAEHKAAAFDEIMSSLQSPAERLLPEEKTDEMALPWGDLVAYASTTLRWMPSHEDARVVEALANALPFTTGMRGLIITQELLRRVFGVPEKIARAWAELHPLQQRALKAIGNSGGWKLGPRNFGNYGLLISSYGMPGDLERYRKFLSID